MFRLPKLLQACAILCLLYTTSACAQQPAAQATSDYDKLCKIYEEVLKQAQEPAMIGMSLSSRIKKEIPNVYVHFEKIANADRSTAYGLFKRVAEEQTKNAWDCKVMQEFYSGKYKK